MKYKFLGYTSFEDYYDSLINTLLRTNKTYAYFVDWEKVLRNVSKYKLELSLLNSLREESKRSIGPKFKILVEKYPNVVRAIPALIAERMTNGELYILDDITSSVKTFNFSKERYTKEEINELETFCKKTGVFDLIVSVKDLVDYMIGVEVGIDTNGRKGRSGRIFESMINSLLHEKLKQRFIINWNSDTFSIYKTSQGRKMNRHDFVIRDKENNEVNSIIEVNFYNVQGSKPDSIVGDYINMAREAKDMGIKFIWITDGPAWKNNIYLRKAAEELDWLLNYNLAKKHITRIIHYG